MKIGTKILSTTAALAIGAMALSGAARADPTPECNDANNAGPDGVSGTADDWAGNTECGSNATALGNRNTATGQGSRATNGNNNTATGQGSSAGIGSNNTAIGQSGIAGGRGGRFGFTGNNNTAAGQNSTAMGEANSALGSGAQAGNFVVYDEAGNFVDQGGFGNARNVAIGAFAEAGARAEGQNGNTAIGHNALANAVGATSLGAGSRVTADNSVALGAGSIADRGNTVSVGAAGAERQIVNVAAGTALTDAVNVGQLNSALSSLNADLAGLDSRLDTLALNGERNHRQANGGIAAAMALGGSMIVPDSTVSLNFNLATYRGEQGFSGAVVVRAAPRIYISGGFAGSTVRGSTGGRVGFAIGF